MKSVRYIDATRINNVRASSFVEVAVLTSSSGGVLKVSLGGVGKSSSMSILPLLFGSLRGAVDGV